MKTLTLTGLKTPVIDLEFGDERLDTRIKNTLRRNGIMNLGDLVSRTEADLHKIFGLGPVCRKAIKAVLERKGYRLGQHGKAA